MPRKLPTRPTAEISQNFNSGAVIVYGVTDVAPAGRQPVYKLTQKCVLRYEERQLGSKRLYLSRQNNAEIVRVVRVPCPGIPISSQDEAQTEDGQRSRIDTVQAVEGCYPPALDLSLRAVEENFDARLTKEDDHDVE